MSHSELQIHSKKVNLDSFQKIVLHKVIYNFHKNHNALPTSKQKILNVFKKERECFKCITY